MNSYYLIVEVEPQADNPLIAHVSRAVSHIWVLATDLDEARDIILKFLQVEHWDLTKENNALLLTPEMVNEMGAEEMANYQTAQQEGIKAKFYYWHRSE